MKKSTGKLLMITGAVIGASAVAAATSFAATKYLMKVALDREAPKAPKGADRLIAGSMEDNAFLAELTNAGERLRTREHEIVEITAHDGTMLIGHWMPCAFPKRILIAMHGWRSSWYHDFGTVADFWRENGCSVLYAEERGQGGSGGDYMGFGLTERYDCLDWVNWVNGRFGTELPIYLCGVSMGAAAVLMAAGLDLPENVHGIGADCGFTSPDAIWRHIANDNLHISFGLRGKIADEICRRMIDYGSGDYSTIEALKNTTVPVLLIHGTDDTFVPVEMTYENYKACASPKKLFIVPGADHGMSHFVDPEGYEAATKDFWREFDGYTRPVRTEDTEE